MLFKIALLNVVSDAEALQGRRLSPVTAPGFDDYLSLSTSMARCIDASRAAIESLDADYCLLLPSGWQPNIDPFQASNLPKGLEIANVRLLGVLGSQKSRPLLFSKSRLLVELLELRLNDIIDQSVLVSEDVESVAHLWLSCDARDNAIKRQLSRELVKLDVSNEQAWCARGELLESLSRHAEARSVYAAVFDDERQTDNDRWFAAFRLAVIATLNKEPDTLVVHYCERAFNLQPERCEPLVLLATTLRQYGEFEQALSIIKMACDITFDTQLEHSFPHTYKVARYAEYSRCAKQSGDDLGVITAVNHYTVAAYTGRFDRALEDELVAERKAAFYRTRVMFPSKPSKRNQFLVIVPFFNVGALLKDCIKSVLEQNHAHFKVVLIDDASTDLETVRVAKELAGDKRVSLIRNTTNQGPLNNQLAVLKTFSNPNAIAVFLDGDDRLAHPDVLSYLNAAYHSTGCWLTHGQWQSMQTGRQGYARPILNHESLADVYRNGSLVFPIHPRTHRVGLLHRLLEMDPNLDCLRNRNGDIFRRATDLAYMRVMMQLAGPARCQFIPEVLYLYNEANPQSHHNIDRQGLIEGAADVGAKPSLTALHSYLPALPNTLDASACSRPPARVVLLTLDGADPDLIKRMIEAGHMPNFKAILSEQATIEHFIGGNNNAFWRGVFTAQKPGSSEALYRDFYAVESDELDSVFNHHAYLTVDGFWNSLGFANYKVAVLNPPEVALYQEVPNVTYCSSWLMHSPKSALKTDPPELEAALRQLSSDQVDLGMGSETWGALNAEEELALASVIGHRLRAKTQAYSELLAHGDWDLFVCGLDGTHDGMHKLWTSDQRGAKGLSLCEQHYLELDQSVGELLKNSSDAEIYVVAGLGGKRNSSQANAVSDVTEEILAAHSIEYAGSCFKTLPYTPNSTHIKFLVKGRDEKGVIAEEDLDRILDIVSEQWLALRGDVSSDRVVERIIRQRDDFSVEAYSSSLADLVLLWGDFDLTEAYSSSCVSSRTYQMNSDDILEYRVGDHSNAATIYSNFSGISEIVKADTVSVTEIANFVKSRVMIDAAPH